MQKCREPPGTRHQPIRIRVTLISDHWSFSFSSKNLFTKLAHLKLHLGVSSMDILREIGVETREELMISPNGSAEPIKRLAHFLKPCTNSIEGKIFELPSNCLTSVPLVFEPEKWPLMVEFHGWNPPQKKWATWVSKMAALHGSTWKKAGIYEAILSSTYKIRRNSDMVLHLAEKWCPGTKSFIFCWGEATVTLEDLMMIAGYSVLGSPVFIPLETDDLRQVEQKLLQMRKECCRSVARKADCSSWIAKIMDSGSEIEHEAFLALWLSRFVFPRPYRLVTNFTLAVHLARGTRIALAPSILAHIYRDLSLLKEKIVALTETISSDDENCKLKIIISSPFQLVQVWAWERFVKLRPNPNLIKVGEPRIAQWHKLRICVDNVMTVLDSSQECFDWRPYTKTLSNCKLPVFYGDQEMLVSVDADLSEELQSFAWCLRISELVGIDCIEQYFPHRVAMQFGMDQDLPTCVARADESPSNLYVPSRFYKAEVTTRYLEWWKQFFLVLQGASDGPMQQKRTLTSSRILAERSKQVKQRNFYRFQEKPVRAKGKKGSTSSSRSRLASKRRKSLVRMLRRSDRRNDLDGTLTSSFLNGKGKSLEIYKQKSRGIRASITHCSTFKRVKKLVKTSEDKKEDQDSDTSSKFPQKMLPLKLIIQKELNNASVPPGFHPKSNLIQKTTSAVEDTLAIQDSKVTDGEYLSRQSQTFPSLIADTEVVKTTKPPTEFLQNEPAHDFHNAKIKPAHDFQNTNVGDGENLSHRSQTFSFLDADKNYRASAKIVQNEPAHGGSENVNEVGIENLRSCLGRDMSTNECGNEADRKSHSVVPYELEARVSRMERIVAALKAAQLGLHSPI